MKADDSLKSNLKMQPNWTHSWIKALTWKSLKDKVSRHKNLRLHTFRSGHRRRCAGR